jgi:hypothetical protein
MLKSIGAVLAGFVTVFVLSVVTDLIFESVKIFPPATRPEAYVWWMLLGALFYRTGYAIVGGFVTAKLAPGNPMKHVKILAIIGTAAATLGMLANLGKSDLWYPLALALLSYPSVWYGGKLALAKAKKKSSKK